MTYFQYRKNSCARCTFIIQANLDLTYCNKNSCTRYTFIIQVNLDLKRIVVFNRQFSRLFNLGVLSNDLVKNWNIFSINWFTLLNRNKVLVIGFYILWKWAIRTILNERYLRYLNEKRVKPISKWAIPQILEWEEGRTILSERYLRYLNEKRVEPF